MKILIEVGAYDGSDSLEFHSKNYKVFSFEPKKDLYNALYEKTKNLNNYTIIPKAVCLNNGKTMFNICKEGGASSILEFRKEEELEKTWLNRTDIHYSGESYEVDTIRLDTFIEEYNLENSIIDYLHIDAQGVDLDCLISLGKYIKNIKEGVVETVIDINKSIYLSQTNNTLENIDDFLAKNDFTITEITQNDDVNCEYNIYFKNNKLN
jgi:FkbM family methyltransferase